LLRVPLDREVVEAVGEGLAGRQLVGAGHGGAAGVAGAVQAAGDLPGLLAAELHGVDLAAGGPGHLVDVGAEQPERGPEALPRRQLDARLEAAVLLLEESTGEDARRGVSTSLVVLLQ